MQESVLERFSGGILLVHKFFYMKKQFLIILLLVLAINVFSQSTITLAPEIKAGFLEKSKKQKTTAWVMLGGAVVFNFWANQYIKSKSTTFDDLGTVLVIAGAGGLCIIGSISLFFASARNLHRAYSATMSVDLKKSSLVSNSSIRSVSYPALTVKLSL